MYVFIFCLHICMKNNFRLIILAFFNIMSKISLKIKNRTADLISIIYLLIYYRVIKIDKIYKRWYTRMQWQPYFINKFMIIFTTILTIYDNDNSDDLCHWTFYFSSTRIYKTKLEYILILTYKYDMYTYYVFIYDVVVIHFRNQK